MIKKKFAQDTKETPGIDEAETNQKKLRVLEKQKKQLKNLQDQSDQSLKHVEKNLEETFKKFVCALRLDMISDWVEDKNPKIAQDIDAIADSIENSEWGS